MPVEIGSVSHKALRRFVETGNAKSVPGDPARIRNMIAFLVQAESIQEFRIPPNFGAHLLTGEHAGVWALTVTHNWRMTFRLNDEGAIIDLDLEDYH